MPPIAEIIHLPRREHVPPIAIVGKLPGKHIVNEKLISPGFGNDVYFLRLGVNPDFIIPTPIGVNSVEWIITYPHVGRVILFHGVGQQPPAHPAVVGS